MPSLVLVSPRSLAMSLTIFRPLYSSIIPQTALGFLQVHREYQQPNYFYCC